MPKVIKERNLTFTFPDTWHPVKYDDHVIYRSHVEKTGAELKSLDIVCRNDQHELILIEIKDFRGYARQNRARQAHGELEQEVIEKVMHTLSGLYLGAARRDPKFQPFAPLPAGFPTGMHFILFMEDDPLWNSSNIARQNQKNYRTNISLKLTERLKKNTGILTKLLCLSDVEARDGFTVA